MNTNDLANAKDPDLRAALVALRRDHGVADKNEILIRLSDNIPCMHTQSIERIQHVAHL